MKNRHRSIVRALIALGLVSLLALSCAKPEASAEKRLTVSILPQTFFVETISGGAVKALVLVGPGQDPHSFDPSPQQMAELARSSGWIRMGMEFENGLGPKVAALYPKLPLFDGAAGVVERRLEAHRHSGEALAAGHGDEGGGRDPHFWLGRQGAKALAANTLAALVAILPERKADFEARHAALAARIDETYDALKAKLEPLGGSTVFVYHPAFGYFLDEFDLDQEAVETGGKEPTQKILSTLIAEAKGDGAKVLFVQKQFPLAAAEALAKAIGGSVVPMDDLSPDWLDNVVRMGDAVAGALR